MLHFAFNLALGVWRNALSQRGGYSTCNLPLCSARPGAIAFVWAAVTHGRGDASEAERGSGEHAKPAPCHGRPGSHAHLHVHRCAWRGRQDTFQLTFTPSLTHLLINIPQQNRIAPTLVLTHLTNTQRTYTLASHGPYGQEKKTVRSFIIFYRSEISVGPLLLYVMNFHIKDAFVCCSSEYLKEAYSMMY